MTKRGHVFEDFPKGTRDEEEKRLPFSGPQTRGDEGRGRAVGKHPLSTWCEPGTDQAGRRRHVGTPRPGPARVESRRRVRSGRQDTTHRREEQMSYVVCHKGVTAMCASGGSGQVAAQLQCSGTKPSSGRPGLERGDGRAGAVQPVEEGARGDARSSVAEERAASEGPGERSRLERVRGGDPDAEWGPAHDAPGRSRAWISPCEAERWGRPHPALWPGAPRRGPAPAPARRRHPRCLCLPEVRRGRVTRFGHRIASRRATRPSRWTRFGAACSPREATVRLGPVAPAATAGPRLPCPPRDGRQEPDVPRIVTTRLGAAVFLPIRERCEAGEAGSRRVLADAPNAAAGSPTREDAGSDREPRLSSPRPRTWR